MNALMKPNPGIEALLTLARIGYKFTLAGVTIKAKYHGPGEPDPGTVKPMLEAVREHKPEVLAYLSKPAMPERILSCADCGFHEYQGPNPAQGWGHCTFTGKWCYGLRPACSEMNRQDTNGPLDG